MKKLLLVTGLVLLCIAMLAGCPGNPTPPTPPAPEDDGKLVYRVADDFPTAAGTAADGVWGYYSVNSGSTAKGDYTALTNAADQGVLGALGMADGNAALANGTAVAADGKDVAYGFTAPREGVITLSTETLARASAGSAAFAIYKNGVRIWPLAIDAYDVPDANKAALVSVKTAVKAGDTLYFRVSTNGAAAKLSLSPVVTYEKDVAYTVAADLEATPVDLTGTVIQDAGAKLPEGSIAAIGRTPSDTVIELTGADFSRAFTRENLVPGATYRITTNEPLVIEFSSQSSYDGMNCYVYAPGGITFDPRNNITFSNLTIAEGKLTIAKGENLTLIGIEALGGMQIEEGCTGLRMENCRAASTETALTNYAPSSTIVNCFFSGKSALKDATVGGNLYENCIFNGEDVAVTLEGNSTTVWYSDIRGDVTTTGNSQNLLVAMNRFDNLGGVIYTNTHNSVVLLNEIGHVSVKNSTNAYVCSNTLYSTLDLEDVNYMLATRNRAFGNVIKTNLTNFNGDNITDVNARTEYGANEDLLPHINKDAFINMERKDFVRLSDGSKMTISQYINQKSKNNGMLIVAPGAYSTKERIYLKNIENFTVYAYGVLYEKYDCLGDVFNITKCKNYSFRGMTVDMVINGCGQMVVLDKNNGVVTYCVAAGLFEDPTSTKYYSMGGGNGIGYMGYRAGKPYPYADISIGYLTYNAITGLATSSPSSSVYNMMEPGDIVTCRAEGGNVANLYENTAVEFEDVTILSGSVRCFWDSWAVEGTVLNRVMVSPAPAKVIDKAMYEKYKAYNDQYGVDTLVYIDDFGNYRGTPMRTVTADSTHTSNSLTGMKATSCIFEGLSDDGTNQQGFHGRLAAYDPATGTITYKERISSLGYISVCASFAVGDRVYVYTSSGRTVCDTEALTVTKKLSEINGYMHYEIKVDPAAFDHSLLEKFDLSADGANDPRILIDNRTRNGDGFIFDNIRVQNIRSRGFLVKCASNEIKHCTFRNIGMAAIGLIFEPEWGESGVCDNTLIAYNYIENTGYFVNQSLYSPITIQGLNSTSTDDDCLPYKNIQIIGNVVRDRATEYALYINSAMDVLVKDNDFGEKAGNEENTSFPSVRINYSKNITFDNNIYSSYAIDILESIDASGHINVNGSDINGLLADDEMVAGAAHTSMFTENLPTASNGLLVPTGAWAVGFATPKLLSTFQPFQVITDSGWYSYSESSLWSSSGGMDAGKDFRFAALQSSNVAIRYTAEYSGTVKLHIFDFKPPYTVGSGSDNGYFAIFVNDVMVWPKQGGSYTEGIDWYLITQRTTLTELQDSIGVLELQLNEGDVISFISKRKDGWCAFAAIPFIYYTKIDE